MQIVIIEKKKKKCHAILKLKEKKSAFIRTILRLEQKNSHYNDHNQIS